MADIFGAGGHVREASARVFLAAKRQAFARSSRRITKLISLSLSSSGDGFFGTRKDPSSTPASSLAAAAWLAPSRTDGGDAAVLGCLLGQPRNDHQSAAIARRAMPPPDDDRAVDDASQALSELSDNVNDFLRMQAKVGIPSLVERLPRRARGRAVVVHTPATRARRARVERRARP